MLHIIDLRWDQIYKRRDLLSAIYGSLSTQVTAIEGWNTFSSLISQIFSSASLLKKCVQETYFPIKSTTSTNFRLPKEWNNQVITKDNLNLQANICNDNKSLQKTTLILMPIVAMITSRYKEDLNFDANIYNDNRSLHKINIILMPIAAMITSC